MTIARSDRTRIAILLTIAALGAVPNLVRGHAGDADPDKVHACVHKKNGRVRFIAAGASCKRNESAMHLAIQGEAGTAGPTGASGPEGPPGPPGSDGRSALTPLGSGETVSGIWGAMVTAGSGGAIYAAYGIFPVPLAAGIPDGKQIYVAGASAPNCPGPGQAAPGYLCVYQRFTTNASTPTDGSIFDPSADSSGASRWGFGIVLFAPAGGVSAVSGTFAVTAP